MQTDERARRERRRYEQGLERDTYRRILRHCAAYSGQFADIRRALSAAHGRTVLELGSRAWAQWLESAGIVPRRLCLINISASELEVGRDLLTPETRNDPDFHLMDAHALAFDDDTFDVVYGGAILHHLDLSAALPEIRRVLKPGGMVVFAEPLDVNPVARLIRVLTPGARTADEQPFRRRELAMLREHFDCTIKPYQLFSVPLGVLSGLLVEDPRNRLTRFAHWLDEGLLRLVPGLGIFYRKFTLVGTTKPASGESGAPHRPPCPETPARSRVKANRQKGERQGH